MVSELFTYAGFTYGPSLGLFAFGLMTRLQVKDALVPVIAILSPVICIILYNNSFSWFGYRIGFEILILNGVMTFAGLLLAALAMPAGARVKG